MHITQDNLRGVFFSAIKFGWLQMCTSLIFVYLNFAKQRLKQTGMEHRNAFVYLSVYPKLLYLLNL